MGSEILGLYLRPRLWSIANSVLPEEDILRLRPPFLIHSNQRPGSPLVDGNSAGHIVCSKCSEHIGSRLVYVDTAVDGTDGDYLEMGEVVANFRKKKNEYSQKILSTPFDRRNE